MKKALAFLTMLMVAVTIWIAPTVPALAAYKHYHAGRYYYYGHRWHAKPLPRHHWRYKKYRNHHYYYYY